MIGTEPYTDKYIMERLEIMSKVAVVYWSGTGNTATGVIFRGLPLSGLRRDVTLRCCRM